jgi:hypothetical protein
MPVYGGNPMSQMLLARYVSGDRRYQDLYECRQDPLRFIIVDQTAGDGELLEELTEAEMLARLASWPIRQPRWDEPRLPVGYRTEQGEAWLGWPDGIVP